MDSFTITIIIISLSGFIGAFIKGKKKDRCLKELNQSNIHIIKIKREEKDESDILGQLNIEANCMEIKLNDNTKKENLILYKNEYVSINKIIRYTELQNEKEKKEREIEFNKITNPSLFRKMKRTIIIFFNITKDAIFELSETMLSKTKLSSLNQTEFVESIKSHTSQSATISSYQPIWERYIGKKVVLEQIIDNIKIEYSGILKEYSGNYILLYDVNFKNKSQIKNSDILFPRGNSVIRNLLR
tara:strand:+ start:1282 stop:2013 length:732 start_codon:yes stop_codon:yes gene_type:complete